MGATSTILLALRKRGPVGTVRLLLDKRAKAKRLTTALIRAAHEARLKSFPRRPALTLSEEAASAVIEQADAMLQDENFFFSFLYHLKGVSDPWSYDPLQKAYWPKRHYEETRVHGSDTPRDVKLVWEINRFKDLPTLAVAAYITRDEKYAQEAFGRMLSWIDGNPFMGSVNWSSPLEIAIRLISWTATLRLLSDVGFDKVNQRISRSIWEQTVFLNAQLSTDKIVRSNHLIGETAGLYVVSSLFEFPEAKQFAERAKKLLCDAVIEQTYPDGASREASGWYHCFVADFVELAQRAAEQTGGTLPAALTERARLMKIYRNSIEATDNTVVKYGDFDNGRVTGLSSDWRDVAFGRDSESTSQRLDHFDVAQHVTAKVGKDYLFLRAGEFGWGGSGFSSHAHDDLLAPIVYLDGLPILVDPGTYVYVGYPAERDALRVASAHNRIIIGDGTGAELKQWFGWMKTSSPATVLAVDRSEDEFSVRACYDNSRGVHERECRVGHSWFTVSDTFLKEFAGPVEWNFHFHPRWRLEAAGPRRFALHDYRNNRYVVELSGVNGELELLEYEFSPAYMTKTPAQKLRMRTHVVPAGTIFRLELTRSS